MSTSDATSDSPTSFEQALAELQQITQRLEDGEQGLERGLVEFERGVQLLRTCYQLLDHAEQRIELLVRVSEQGEVETRPFDATATAQTAVVGRRASRRTRTNDTSAPPADNS